MKFRSKAILIALFAFAAIIVSFFFLNAGSPVFAKSHEKDNVKRTEEYVIISYSNLDKSNLIVWHGHNKKETIQLKKDEAVIDPVLNVMHSLNSEGWELVNNESFPYLNVVGNASNLDSDSFHTIIFVMKRKLVPEPEKE